VTVRYLRKTYRSRTVVDVLDLDLDVRDGEILGLAGANGAGKTTTVECIQGLCRPDSGTLAVLGAALVDELGRLEGVRAVRRDGARFTVHGSRATIAHAGAVLVRH
jgi:ABC-type multidrug transport system ATPase subunit